MNNENLKWKVIKNNRKVFCVNATLCFYCTEESSGNILLNFSFYISPKNEGHMGLELCEGEWIMGDI